VRVGGLGRCGKRWLSRLGIPSPQDSGRGDGEANLVTKGESDALAKTEEGLPSPLSRERN